jgi:hypothetical protein
MERRDFLGLGLVGGIAIFAPRLGRWFRPNRVYVPDGRYIELAHYFELPAGVGVRAEDEYIPRPTGPVIVNVRVEKRLMPLSRTDRAAFERYVRRELARQVKLPRERGGLERLVDELDFRPFRNLGHSDMGAIFRDA